ncbi:MAG: hypothetical protein WA775_07465 [Psychroserpens sp.]|uniref:hypothetical protein n=1 Tax=Psychroserpens sp. TaxID=2020870 RepID=UPI003C75861C
MKTDLTTSVKLQPKNHLDFLFQASKSDRYYTSESYNSKVWHKRRVALYRLAY